MSGFKRGKTTTTIDGKLYQYVGWSHSKATAQNWAKELRKEKESVRVVHSGKMWQIWAR